MNEKQKTIMHIALTMLEGKSDLLITNDETKIKFIIEAHKFAQLFYDISLDNDMTWNGGDHE